MNTYMQKANNLALEGMKNKEGGPFGAVIVDKNGNIISQGNNKVLKNNDPTAHAEIVAIRNACEKLNTFDLVHPYLLSIDYKNAVFFYIQTI